MLSKSTSPPPPCSSRRPAGVRALVLCFDVDPASFTWVATGRGTWQSLSTAAGTLRLRSSDADFLIYGFLSFKWNTVDIPGMVDPDERGGRNLTGAPTGPSCVRRAHPAPRRRLSV